MNSNFEKKLTTSFDRTFFRNLCERFSKEDLAGMYTLANKREEKIKECFDFSEQAIKEFDASVPLRSRASADRNITNTKKEFYKYIKKILEA